jgi:hypothetical protein
MLDKHSNLLDDNTNVRNAGKGQTTYNVENMCHGLEQSQNVAVLKEVIGVQPSPRDN